MTDNLRIWSQVDKTDPGHTKTVSQRGGFTAISAAYQIKRATETFGPIGEGWGYMADEPIFHDLLVFVPVTLWHSSDRRNTFGPMTGGAEWKSNKGHLDSDAVKKATTDALTKLLSQLGFNADVFLGLFDDNKYVESMKAEFAEPKAGATPPKPPTLSERADRFVTALKNLPTVAERKKAYDLASKLLADLDASDPERLVEINALYEELQAPEAVAA